MINNRILKSILLCIVINFIIAIPSLAAVAELEEEMTWSNLVKLNGQLFGSEKITVIGKDRVEEETIWTIKDEFFYKIIDEDKNIDEYQSQTIIRLREDFTLKSLKNTVKKNRHDISYESIDENEGGYIYFKKAREHTEEKTINTQEALFLYDYTYPWMIEMLIKNKVLSMENTCPAISPSGQLISIDYMNNPSKTDKSKYFCYLANNDKIYLNKNEDVIRIDSENIGIIEFIPGEALSEQDLIGYDLKRNVELTGMFLY